MIDPDDTRPEDVERFRLLAELAEGKARSFSRRSANIAAVADLVPAMRSMKRWMDDEAGRLDRLAVVWYAFGRWARRRESRARRG